MAIKPKCDKCKEELTGFGGLAFSPPTELEDGSCARPVDKIHLCKSCWNKFMKWLDTKEKVYYTGVHKDNI